MTNVVVVKINTICSYLSRFINTFVVKCMVKSAKVTRSERNNCSYFQVPKWIWTSKHVVCHYLTFLILWLTPLVSGFLLSLPQFNESMYSYASAPWPQPSHNYLSFMEFEMTFQPTNPDGTLLYTDDAASRDFLSISLVCGYVEFRFDCGSGATVIRWSV